MTYTMLYQLYITVSFIVLRGSGVRLTAVANLHVSLIDRWDFVA